MGQILELIQELSGGTCYQTERFALDYFDAPEYQDEGEKFSHDSIFETDKKEKRKHKIELDDSLPSLFRYFMDGSERVYKIADFGSTDGKFLPIVAGQIGAAICTRKDKRLKKHLLERKNVIALPDRVGDEFETIAREIPRLKIPRNETYQVSIGQILKYDISKGKNDTPFENLARAKIQHERMKLEIQLIQQLANSTKLKTNRMLVVDGSLKFSITNDIVQAFENVIGISKTFNPNLQGMLHSRNKQIGSYLLDLEFGERTPVYVYQVEGQKSKNIRVGAWYLRIRDKEKMRRPLDGIIKIEKVVTKRDEDGFDTDTINQISLSVLLERNVTCYGADKRWANHIYPVYLTELLLKNSFVSNLFFLNLF